MSKKVDARKPISDKVKDMMKASEMSHETLAEKMGLKESNLNAKLYRHTWRIEDLVKLEEIFHMNLYEVYKRGLKK